MNERYQQQLEVLSRELVKPERFGDVALQDTVEFEPIQETYRPQVRRTGWKPDSETTLQRMQRLGRIE